MNVDIAKANFEKLMLEWTTNKANIETEQDVRFQMINRVLTEVLGWSYSEITTERHVESGYVDYLITVAGRGRLVVEAKRTEIELIDTKMPRFSWYNAGGSAIKSAQDGLNQAIRYCAYKSVMFSTVTNGFQWIGLWTLRSDGVPPLDGKAAVFPSLEAINQEFAKFYDLFSREGVLENLYQAYVHEAEGMYVRFNEDLTAANQNTFMLPKGSLAGDLETIFLRFFSSLSGDDDLEMLAACFVESKESREADENFQKIARELINSIDVVDSSKGVRLSEDIKTAVERKIGEFVLIVGNKGAGKTTFIDRFFRIVLDRRIRDRCLVLRIDLADAVDDAQGISAWLTDRMKQILEKEMFAGGIPSYEQLQGVFIQEYDRWRLGERKFLYDDNKVDFKKNFGEWMAEIINHDPAKYVQHLLESAVRQRKLMPCIVFDNADQFSQLFQDTVFQFAQSLHRSVFSFIICPITDRTIWQLSKSGPMQSYQTRTFYLPVPSTKEVLSRRVSYIHKKLNEKQSGTYFLGKGVRVSIPDISAFAQCIEDIFVNEEYVGRMIGWLANHDIRRSLNISERIITSPTMTVTELVSAYVGGRRALPPTKKIKQALMRGNYNVFRQEDSPYIINLFSVESTALTSPLLRLSVLRLLRDVSVDSNDIIEGYMRIGDVANYFEPFGVPPNIAYKHLQALMDFRLIQPYNPTDQEVTENLHVRITHSGKIHYEFAFDYQEWSYVQEMALITPMRSSEYLSKIQGVVRSKYPRSINDWGTVCRQFMSYCLHEDTTFIQLPDIFSYEGQHQMRRDLRTTWS